MISFLILSETGMRSEIFQATLLIMAVFWYKFDSLQVKRELIFNVRDFAIDVTLAILGN